LSYILDALKKADAERERSAVPGLHAHPQDEMPDAPRGVGGLPWPALAIGSIVLLGGALAWMLWSEHGARTPPLSGDGDAAVATAAPPTPAAAPQQAAMPAPAPAPPAAAPLPVSPPVAAAPVAAAPAPGSVTPPPPIPAATERVTPPPPTQLAPPRAAKLDAPAEPRVPTLKELPAEVRSALPPLNVSGAVYSPTPSARMLFINGQVLREGQAVADGVLVERIGASSSVLSARGQRFELKH
jgi:general secretion pathway protein B